MKGIVYIIFTILIFDNCQVFSNVNTYLKKNSDPKHIIYAGVGFQIVKISSTINYEYNFISSERYLLNARFGYGAFGIWGDTGEEYIAGLSFLLGKRSHLMEIDAGYIQYGNYNDYPRILLNIGYRHQPIMRSGIVFRIGVGTEMPYISLGFIF